MEKYLMDFDFLVALSQEHVQEQYARAQVFDKHKNPVERFEGIITTGTINIDGSATLRRSCSLSLNAFPHQSITDAYWALTHEFRLEIGLKNNINHAYPDIIWFPMGHYIITGFSISENSSGITISISGQDLMAKLSGVFGGTLGSEVDFGKVEIQQANGTTLLQKVPIETIIQTSLLQYGLEMPENIIINDLPEDGKELLEYRGDKPLYLIFTETSTSGSSILNIVNYTLDGSTPVFCNGIQTSIQNIEQFWSLSSPDQNYNLTATKIQLHANDHDSYYVAKIEFGNTVGYRPTPLVYAGDLILKRTENVASLLNKIKTMLNNFEFFYDEYGRFVFQKHKTYLQELFSPIKGDIIEPLAVTSPTVYEFKDHTMFTSFSHSSAIDKVYNDVTIWGKKASTSGSTVDIHARCAIDKKPTRYVSPWGRYEKIPNLVIAYRCVKIDNNYFLDTRSGLVYFTTELNQTIYQPAHILKECKYSELKKGEAFYQLTERAFSTQGIVYTTAPQASEYIYQKISADMYEAINIHKTPQLYTKDPNTNEYIQLSEQFLLPVYTNIYSYGGGGQLYKADEYDWRELIYQMAFDYTRHNTDVNFYQQIYTANPDFIDGHTGYEQYYTDILEFWRTLYNPYDYVNFYPLADAGQILPLSQRYWNRTFYSHPETALFWFDFLDTGDTEVDKYSVKKIGRHAKVENKNNNNTTIFQAVTPEIIFSNTIENVNEESYSNILQLPDSISSLVTISAQGQSLIEQMNNILYTSLSQSTNISIQSLPMFWLQPNTRIAIDTIGEVIIDKIILNLDAGNAMSLTCTIPPKSLF